MALCKLPQFALIKHYEVLMFKIQINMPMRRNQSASRYAPFSRIDCAAWVCSFEFKILRVIMGLSVHTEQNVYINTCNIFALTMLRLRQLQMSNGKINVSTPFFRYFVRYLLSTTYVVNFFFSILS